jgi:hypothetical protein
MRASAHRIHQVAKFGRGFLDLYDPTDFVTMGQTLKVLNAVRYHEIGIPITYPECVNVPPYAQKLGKLMLYCDRFTYTSPSHLISRLTSRNLHLLALRISTHLSLPPDAVLKHWACAKIARTRSDAALAPSSSSDEEVCALIVKKFASVPGGAGVSFAEIARRAWEVGRAGLATKLLDHEGRAEEQVPLLLSMKEDRLALAKAVDSGDTDLGERSLSISCN